MLPRAGLLIIPIQAEPKFASFDLPSEVRKAIAKSGESVQDGDILIISSKYAALSEGRMVELSRVVPDEKSRELAKKFNLEATFAKLVLDESDTILGGIPGFVLTVVSGTLAPNAGIDRSNVPKGFVVLYPKDAFETVRNLREKLLERPDLEQKPDKKPLQKLGIVLSDSRVTPTRLGTVGVAVSFAGIRATIDMRGTPDLLGNTLQVTLRAIADQLATAAQLVMGESNEGKPIVIIRGFVEAFREPRNTFETKTTISPEQCLILSSLEAN